MKITRLKILYADDAAVFRRLVTDELSADLELEVQTAPNGKIALAKFDLNPPDLVLLDVEMPDMDGLETLRAIRQRSVTIPVIMFSALTERGGVVTLDALSAGATDYFTKPSNVGGLDASLAVVRRQLIPVIKALCRKSWARASETARPPQAPAAPAVRHPLELVCIAASTGGPNALARILGGLPADFPLPILIVQHMPPVFTRLLAERLTANSRLPVAEGISGRALEPGRVWVAPGDWHMVVVRDGAVARLLCHQDPPENYCRPSVEPLFRSAARTFGARTLGVMLTGMGTDGAAGCAAIKEAGGQLIAQDEETSVVWSMPGAVAPFADRVAPLDLIAREIQDRIAMSRGQRRAAQPESAQLA